MTGRDNEKGDQEVETKIEVAKAEDSFAVEVEDESFSRDLQESMTMDTWERDMIDGATGVQNAEINDV